MTPQTVRAVLAYLLTAAGILSIVLVAFVTMTQAQATLVGTVLGAVLSNWKVPLSYFFDGVAISEQDAAVKPGPSTPTAPAPAPAEAPPQQ
jgi:hypothetical protein